MIANVEVGYELTSIVLIRAVFVNFTTSYIGQKQDKIFVLTKDKTCYKRNLLFAGEAAILSGEAAKKIRARVSVL